MPSDESSIKPSTDYDYYHELVTWLSFEEIKSHLNKCIDGIETENWISYLTRKYSLHKRALSVSCGNGWVERALHAQGLIEEVTGIDILQPYLDEAAEEAKKSNLPASYVQLDINRDQIPSIEGGYNMIINHAALHHTACIDKVMRQLCALSSDDARFVSFDYTGPHRNQYTLETWARILELDESAPEQLRHGRLVYPHQKTMLAVDPSEAIHSELILETAKRYFTVEHIAGFGGAIAYPYLHDNATLFAQKDTPEGKAWLGKILEEDIQYTQGDPARSYFTFFVMRPRKEALEDEEQLEKWTREEETRETQAVANGGRYYPRNAWEILSDQLADKTCQVQHLQAALTAQNT